jgi:hypothetical protein
MAWGHNPVMVRLGQDEPGADLTHHLQEGINMAANSERLAPAPRSGGRSWLTWGLLVHLLAGVLVIAPVLLPVPLEAAEIGLFFTEGVTTEDRDTAKKAIAATVNYFETNYRVQLNSNVRMVLAKSDAAMAGALTRHCVMSTKKAVVLGKSSTGMLCQKEDADTILIKAGDLSKADLIIVVCHEIVHKFQQQESYSSYDNIQWLSEGVADVIGAYVAESFGGGPMRWDRQITCLKQLRAERKFPPLTVLHSEKEWLAAGAKYGLGYQYLTAELAVFELAKLKGYKPLFQYFRYLKRYNNAQAFEMAFGVKLSEYENYFDQLLAQKL